MPRWLRALFGPSPASPENVAVVLARLDALEDALAALTDRFGRLQKSRIGGNAADDLKPADLLKLLLAGNLRVPGKPDDPFGGVM